MAQITNHQLTINVNAQTQIATCKVEGRLVLTTYEWNEVKEGLMFKLNCALRGDKSPPEADVNCYVFNTQQVPYGPNALQTYNFRFEAQIAASLLNYQAGQDKIFAQTVSENLYLGKKVVADSNMVMLG